MTMRTTKKSLALSVLSMLICVAMLIGSTFAWFTDNAASGINKIVAGNLDVELQAETADGVWADATNISLFEDNFLWEPGAVMISKPFKVINKGTLALQYTLSLNVDEVKVDGKSLADVVKVAFVPAAKLSRDDIADLTFGDIAAATANGKLAPKEDQGNKNIGGLTAGESAAQVMVLYWAPNSPEVDNQYNLKDQLSIEFALNVAATQVPYEEDSIDANYDDIMMDIKDTVNKGVDKVNAKMDYAQLSSLTEVNEELYTTKVTMDNTSVTIGEVYDDIGALLFGEVNKHAAGIASIAVAFSGEGINGAASINTDGEQIETGTFVLMIAKALDVLGANHIEVARKPISELIEKDISVTITDISGASVTYTLHFDI